MNFWDVYKTHHIRYSITIGEAGIVLRDIWIPGKMGGAFLWEVEVPERLQLRE
jgi:hypothetical protein